jgi:hypothetical protein
MTIPPLARGDKTFNDIADLGSGHRGDVGTGLEPDGIEQCGPRGAAGFQGGHDRVRPAGNHPVLILAPAIGVAERAIRAGSTVWPQPR